MRSAANPCSVQIRATAPVLALMAPERLYASSQGINSGEHSGSHLDNSPWLNGPEYRADRRHQRDEVVQLVGRSYQDHHGHLEPMEALLVPQVLVGGEEHRKVLGSQQAQ